MLLCYIFNELHMAVLAAELKLVPMIRAAICSVESRKQVL